MEQIALITSWKRVLEQIRPWAVSSASMSIREAGVQDIGEDGLNVKKQKVLAIFAGNHCAELRANPAQKAREEAGVRFLSLAL